MTQDILNAIEAAIAEREGRAHRSGPELLAWATYRQPDGTMRYTSPVASDGTHWVTAGRETEPTSVEVVYDPAADARQAQAHRRILELHRPVLVYSEPYCDLCRDEHGRQSSPCETVRALADAYGIEAR